MTGGGVNVRSMEHGDLDAVLLLFDRVAAERLWIGTEPGYDRAKYRQIFAASIDNGAGMFVAEIDGKIAGMLTEYQHGEFGHTLGMMVDRRQRRKGIGRALLLRLEAWARERRIPHLCLLVFPHNEAALALYRSLGYVEIERYPADVVRSTGEVWDTLLMRKELRGAR